MATFYINNTASTAAVPNYSTWATAAQWTSSVARLVSAGDVVYYHSSHAETIVTTNSAAWSWGWLGTSTSPVRVLSCVSTSGQPPSTFVFGASISTTGANNMNVVSTNAWVYFYGMAFNCGTASTAADLTLNSSTGRVVFENCKFKCGAQATGTDLICNAAGGETILINCSTLVTHANTAFSQTNIQQPGILKIIGGQTISTTPNPLLESAGQGSRFYIEAALLIHSIL